MKVKKTIISVVMCALIAVSSTSFAQSVVMEGVGNTKDAAVRDAMRNAVEYVVGTIINSESLMENLTVIRDQVYSKSKGFVNQMDILQESEKNGFYRIKAKMNVDTTPNSNFMKSLQAVMMLQDPRISVVILNDTSAAATFNDYCETKIMEQLLGLGFNRVIDAKSISTIKNLGDLNNVFKDNNLLTVKESTGLDYLVIGKLGLENNKMILPDITGNANRGRDFDTNMLQTRAKLMVRIIKPDTKTLVSSFMVDGVATDLTSSRATDKALEMVCAKVAPKIKDGFYKQAADASQRYQVIVRASSFDMVQKFIDELKEQHVVDNVYTRGYNNGKAVLDVEGYARGHELYRLIKEKSKFGLFLEEASANELRISIN